MFIHGSKEIWAINLKEPTVINRFYIGKTILAVENYNPLNGDQPEIELGLCL